jgi:hypothetical protein
MGSVQPPQKGDYTMALAKDKAKLAVAAVKSEDTQVSYIQFLYSDLGCFVRGTALHMRCSELGV